MVGQYVDAGGGKSLDHPLVVGGLGGERVAHALEAAAGEVEVVGLEAVGVGGESRRARVGGGHRVLGGADLVEIG